MIALSATIENVKNNKTSFNFMILNHLLPPPFRACPCSGADPSPSTMFRGRGQPLGLHTLGGGGFRSVSMMKNSDIETRNSKQEDLEILRIGISRASERALMEIMDQVNHGFIGGKVSKSQMANWILKRFKEELDDSLIKDIRADHFDEVAVLESILRKARESGKVPTEFRHLLQREVGLDVSAKKKPKQALTENGINDVVSMTDK